MAVPQASVDNSKSKLELDLHAGTCVARDDTLIISNYNWQVTEYIYDPKVGHKSA